MAIVRAGRISFPDYGNQTFATGTVTSGLTIDATGEKIAIVGRMWNSSRASKSIRKVGTRWGTVSKTGGSTLTFSLQDVSTTTGPIWQPDGTMDQSVAVPASAISANSLMLTGNMSADRSVAFGELLAIVIEFDGSGRLGTDTFEVVGMSAVANELLGGISLLSGSWSAPANLVPIALLEFSDGTFGSLTPGWGFSDIATYVYNSGTGTFDEYALEFQMPYTCECDGAILSMTSGTASADFDVVLYDSGNTALATVVNDANTARSAGSTTPFTLVWPPVTLNRLQTYRLAVKPTTVNNVNLIYGKVASAAHLAATPGGTNFYTAKRLDLGSSWTTVSTEVPFIQLVLTGPDTAAPPGGGPMPRFALGM